jgi:hypothetical protein
MGVSTLCFLSESRVRRGTRKRKEKQENGGRPREKHREEPAGHPQYAPSRHRRVPAGQEGCPAVGRAAPQ